MTFRQCTFFAILLCAALSAGGWASGAERTSADPTFCYTSNVTAQRDTITLLNFANVDSAATRLTFQFQGGQSGIDISYQFPGQPVMRATSGQAIAIGAATTCFIYPRKGGAPYTGQINPDQDPTGTSSKTIGLPDAGDAGARVTIMMSN